MPYFVKTMNAIRDYNHYRWVNGPDPLRGAWATYLAERRYGGVGIKPLAHALREFQNERRIRGEDRSLIKRIEGDFDNPQIVEDCNDLRRGDAIALTTRYDKGFKISGKMLVGIVIDEHPMLFKGFWLGVVAEYDPSTCATEFAYSVRSFKSPDDPGVEFIDIPLGTISYGSRDCPVIEQLYRLPYSKLQDVPRDVLENLKEQLPGPIIKAVMNRVSRSTNGQNTTPSSVSDLILNG